MREILWPLFRSSGPQVQGLHYAYVKGGLIVHNEPVPWNADAVLVHVLLRFPNGTARRKTDFSLRQPGQPPAAKNAPPVAATSNRKTIRSLKRMTTVCKTPCWPPTAAAPPAGGFSKESVTFDKDISAPILVRPLPNCPCGNVEDCSKGGRREQARPELPTRLDMLSSATIIQFRGVAA